MRSEDITGSTARGTSVDREAFELATPEAPCKNGVISDPIGSDGPLSAPPPRKPAAETSDLERRVLAHERILQSLIAHMTEYDPRFLERLKGSYSEPMKMARRERNYIDTEDYAEEFIQAVVRMSDQMPQDKLREPTAPAFNPTAMSRGERNDVAVDAILPADVRVRERSGVWEVTVNGRFHGDYTRERHAVDAAVVAARHIATGTDKWASANFGS